MGFGQKQEHRYGQRPPPARRPYRENIPNSWKGDPTVNRRPRLDYRSNLESVVQPPNFVPSQPTQVLFSGNPHDVLMSGSPVTHWNSVFPVHAPPGIYPGQDQYGPPGSYVQYIPVNLTPVQQTYPSLALTESSPQVYNSPQLVQSITTLAMQNNFGVNKDVSPAFLSPGYSDAAQAMPEIHQNGVKYDMVWAGAPQPIQPKSAFQYGQQHQPQMVSSHPNVVNHSQAWSVPDPDLVRVMNSANQQHMKYSQIHSELHEMDAIKSIAFKFVEEFCPQVSNTSYCHPPVLRSRHSEKASKQLMMGMESEQRVIGTFERYFAASQIPAFILCHYPLTGFLQEHHKKEQISKRSSDSTPGNNRETVTLILVSHKFCVTAVTVSIVSNNSDFSYIQRGVAKAAGHVAKCGRAVAGWLTSLGLTPTVREVLAFPNLRQAMMQRIARDKALQKSLSKVALLHLDDLCAPFEEEMSTSALRRHFSDWMEQHVLSQPPALSPSDAKLFVGALLSPQLSCVDNMKNMQSLDPIPENVLYSDKEPTNAEVIGQLQLTINGVTMGFDDFMDEYVSSYYPDVETKTYRVPPLHFNIQSFKRGTDYLEDMKDSRRSDPAEKEQSQNNSHFSESESEEEEITGPQEESREEFMPPGRSYCWQAGPVTGRLESAATFSDDESSDSDDVCCGYRRHLPIETVTLDSLPDEQQNFAADQDKDRTDAKTHFESGSTHARLAGTVTSVTSPPSGAPVLLLTPTLQLRNCGKDLPGPITSPAYIETSPSGLNSGQAGHAAPEGGPGSNPAVRRSARSKVAAQAAVLDDTRVLSDVMAKDARADEGENRVINAMELLGQWFGPMFIICSYQYNNYLNKLREEMFCKGEASRPTRAFGQIMRAEHDCLIFHKDIGVLVVCIKAIGDNFSDWNASEDQIKASTAKILHKALKQLEREEAMIRHVTSDLRSRARLVCHSLVALPNMYRKQVDAALDTDPDLAKKIQNLTYGRGTKSFLCLDELPSKNMSVWDLPEESVLTRLVGWWKDLKSSLDAPENAIDIKVYKHIIGRYCGLLSTVEVWSPNNPRVEVRSRSEAVSLCAQRFSQVVLLPGQLQVLLSDHTRVYLYGPPGSGKTLLLMLKAREWLLRGEHVILINSRWGSSNGYPYAYGVLDRLKAMMTKDGVPHERLLMINIDTSRFHDYLLSNVLPSWCVLVDELTSATLPIIEHLCCLQVQNIWCAGLFEERRPHTAHRFQAFKMERVLRCPPILQSLLKHTEKAAKHSAPYWDAYEEPNTQGVVPRSKWSPALYPQQRESDCQRDRNLGGYESSNETSSRSSNGSMKKEDKERENRRFDADSLNTRLAQLSIKYASPRAPARTDPEPGELSSLVSSRAVTGLPTDGPRPHVIDHEGHSQVGLPAHCSACGRELADFLKSMVRTEEPLESQGQGHQQEGSLKPRGDEATRGKFRRTSAGVTRKQNEVRASVNSPDHRLRVRFENRVLSWADVLIVTSSLDKDLPLLKYLARQGIPIELMPSSRQARYIETSRSRQRLFVTTYREVIGLERALIVFVPSGRSDDDFGLVGEKNQFSELKNLSLRHCLQRYSELDRCALWYMASRCLSDLVLLLP